MYRCPICGWVGHENEMDADYTSDDVSEDTWSNWICPSCQTWHQLEDYEVIYIP